MNGEEDIFEVLPEIEHAFRAEQTMPPQIVSLAFTIICLLPSLLLVVSWLKLGVNIGRFPFGNTSKLFNSTVFLGNLGAFLYVLYLYWVRLNIFQALTLLAPLGLALVLTTRNASLDSSSSK